MKFRLSLPIFHVNIQIKSWTVVNGVKITREKIQHNNVKNQPIFSNINFLTFQSLRNITIIQITSSIMSEQVVPLSRPASRISDDGELSPEFKKLHNRHRKYIVCCGITTALILIIVVVLIVLSFTIFHVKEPVVRMNSVTFLGLDRINQTDSTPVANLTVMADVSVKNPNIASYKFGNASSSLFYDEVVIGEARIAPGIAKARRTLHLNVTFDVMLEKVVAVPRFGEDLRSGVMHVTSYTGIKGKIKIINIIKKKVVVRLYCTMMVNIATRAIQEQFCKKQVSKY